MDESLQKLIEELTDPITQDLVEDPIVVPCCTKTFGRLALTQHLDSDYNKLCPTCRQPIPDFDPLTAPTNVVIQGMVNTLKQQLGAVSSSDHQWSATLTPVIESVAELKISLQNSQFRVKPSLFIAVCDTSGSMSGNPWKQVEAALIHIMGMTRTNPMIKTVIIRYSSLADTISTDGSQDEVVGRIKRMFNSGGTNFAAAFDKVKDVLENYTYSDAETAVTTPYTVSSVTIAFLTDGQDNSSYGQNKDALIESFREILQEWEGPICVHSVGFSRSCAKNFLEKLRLTGSLEGSFRYAEPEDNGDTLCQKLTGLFEVISQNSSIPVEFRLVNNGQFRIKSGQTAETLKLQFPVGRNKKGTASQWVIYDGSELPTLQVDSSLDQAKNIPVSLESSRFLADKQKRLFEKWLETLADELAAELLTLNNQKRSISPKLFNLHCGLIQQRIEAIMIKSQNEATTERLGFIYQQVKSLRQGLNIHEGKLSDMRFGSQFSTGLSIKSGPAPQVDPVVQPVRPKLINSLEESLREKPVYYSHNNANKQRNPFQEAIVSSYSNRLTDDLQFFLPTLTEADILHRDTDGNNTIHLICYCGMSYLFEKIVERFPKLDYNLENNDGEMPMTLAIKKRGFWKCIKILIKRGGFVPKDRRKGLEAYTVNHGFQITAKILSTMDSSNPEEIRRNCQTVNKSMTAEYIEFLYETATELKVEINTQAYLEAALSKQMTRLVKKLISDHGALPDIKMLLEYCLPPSPDHPETDKYLDLTKIVIKANRDLLKATDPEGNTPLGMAAFSGSLPHVKYFLRQAPESLDQPNNDGNTPFWIATSKQYPCIMTELLDQGADVNHQNTVKGTPPIFTITRWGSVKIAELLLARGARLDLKNSNGDTLILLCCRSNGQHEKLALFLKYVDPDLIDFRAEIDGFNAVFASVESNNVGCLRVLHDYGADLEQRTAEDNPILPGATPLHLGAYYGRAEAVSLLLELGHNPNALDMRGATALHTAVLQKQANIIKILRNGGVDLTIKDETGSTAAAYCRNDQEIREILISPALDPLMSLARGDFNQSETTQACELLRQSSGAPGCLSSQNALDLVSQGRRSILLEAVIHSNYLVVKTLLELGCDRNFRDRHGLSAYLWAQWINNQRIKGLLTEPDKQPEETKKSLARLRSVPAQHRMLLFISNKPAVVSQRTESGIVSRMEDFVTMIYQCTEDQPVPAFNLIADGNQPTSIIPVFEQIDFGGETYESLLWNAKVFIIGLIASGQTDLSPPENLALCLYTSNPVVSRIINNAIIKQSLNNLKPYISCLTEAYQKLPPFVGEVFIGANQIDRTKYQIGSVIAFQTFISASLSWRVATEHLENFNQSKKRRGIVFIVKSKTGRLVSQHSEFMYDMEVLFKPNIKFKITNWYQGDIICLGQENIREYTFGITEAEDIEDYLYNKRSLFIELHEI